MRDARLFTVSYTILTWRGGVCLAGGSAFPGEGSAWRKGRPPADPFPPVERMTDMCNNITFPHTAYAGGNNVLSKIVEAFIYTSISMFGLEFRKAGTICACHLLLEHLTVTLDFFSRGLHNCLEGFICLCL